MRFHLLVAITFVSAAFVAVFSAALAVGLAAAVPRRSTLATSTFAPANLPVLYVTLRTQV